MAIMRSLVCLVVLAVAASASFVAMGPDGSIHLTRNSTVIGDLHAQGNIYVGDNPRLDVAALLTQILGGVASDAAYLKMTYVERGSTYLDPGSLDDRWNVRPWNRIEEDTGVPYEFIEADSTIWLDAGVYDFSVETVTHETGWHQVRIRDVQELRTLAAGSIGRSISSADTPSTVTGRLYLPKRTLIVVEEVFESEGQMGYGGPARYESGGRVSSLEIWNSASLSKEFLEGLVESDAEADPGVYTMEEFAIMSEMEAEGNTWTTFTTDIWVQRKLNAIRANYGGIISFHDPVTGYFQLRPGSYRVYGRASSPWGDRRTSRIYRVSPNPRTVVQGQSVYDLNGYVGHFSLIEGRLTTDGNDTFVMETHCDDVCYNVRMTNTGDSLPSLGCDLLIERIEPGVTSKEAMLQYRIQYGRNAGDITGYNWINNRQELNHVAYNDDQIVSLNADGSFVLGPGTFEYHFAFQTYASDHNTARLWSETDKLVLGFGTSAYSRYADVSDAANAEGWGTLHLLKPHTIFFEGFSTRSITNNGIGVECSCEGADELYNFVKIRQVERISNQTAEVREFTYPLSNGPSMTGGLWQAREFNQVARGEQWISFPPARLHKQVLVQPGVYLADFFSATSTSDNSMTRIASMDEFNVMAVGSSQHVSPSYAKTGVSRGLGLLELAHPTELRVEHWSSTTNLFGRPSYSGNPEWHARLHLTRMHGLSDELAARVAELEDVDYYDDTDYDYILIEERQSPGIPAPPCPSVALENPVIRQISVMLEDGNGAATMSAATRTITLQPGVYDYRVRGSIRNCGEHKIVLQKTSGIPFTVGHGTSAYSASTTNSESTLVGRLVVDTASDFQIHHYTRSTPGTANAMGEAMPVLSGDGPEKYITAEFWVRSNHTAPKVHLRSSKGFATTAGASVANTWNQRDLEENFDDNGTLSMLDSFHFQLRAGVYDYRVEVPAFSTDDHRARLWDSTNERQVGLGSSSRCSTNNNGMSKLWGRLYVFNDTNQYSVQHWTESSEAFGMGYPAQIGSFDEYYASVELFRINPANVHTVILRELYEPGTHGPSYPDDRQSVRPFNHIVAYGETFAKLNDDSFTLVPGVYDIRIEVPARRADRFRARLFSKSDFSVVAWGTNTRAAIEELTAWSFIYARLYVPRTTNFQVESFAETASSTYVHRSDQGDMEIYTQGEIRRRPLASDDYIASLSALSAKPDTVGWIIRDTRPPRVAYTGLESTRGWNLRDMDPKAIQYLNEGSREYMEYNAATNEMIFLVAGSYDVEFEVTAHRTLGTRCRLACNGTTPYLYSTSGHAPNGASYADSRVFAWGRVHVQNNTACRFESGYQAIGAANHAGGTASMDGAQASFLSAEFVRHEGSSDDVYIMRETRGYFTNGNPSSSSADVNLRWKTRAMDSKTVGDGSDVTINTDGSFTVQPGVYDIQALAVGYECNGHQSRLYRVSPSPGPVQYPATPPIAASGLSAHARRNAYINTASYLLGRIEPMTATTYRLEQWTETYDAAGEGLMSRMGPEDEVYAMVKITKTSGNLIAFEKRSPGSFGGSVVANTWNPRSITHIIADTPFFTLLAGTFTLDPGLYKVYAAASAYASDYTRLRLYDRTHSAVLVLGETMYGHSGTSGSQHVSLRGAIEVREISELEIQHYCSRDSGSLTLGNPTSAPQSNEIFTILSIEPL